MTEGKNRIMIYGPKDDGTYVVEFRMAGGEALAISIPKSEARVIRHFQERMPHGLVVPEMKVLDDDMDNESVTTKLHQARSSLDEMRACERRVFGDNKAKFGQALSGFLGAVRSVVYLLEKMASYKTWRKEWNAQNPSKDRLLKCIHDKRNTDVHEGRSGHIAKPGKSIKVGIGSSYSDESGKLEVWGSPSPLLEVDLNTTISKTDYVFDVCGTERPVTEACAEYLTVLEQMVAQFKADTSELSGISMTTLTMRVVRGDFVVTGPDVEPMKFKSRREAKDWCKTHHPGSPITEVGPGGKRAPPKKPVR